MRRKLALLACLGIAGCAQTIWDKPGATQAEFTQDSARCRLMARGMNPGDFYAQGSAQFVAGAALGNAVGTAINQQQNYRDCMMVVGYTPQDPQTQAIATKLRPILAQFATCSSALYGAPEADPIRRRIPFDGREATPDQLSDAAFASQQEINAINLIYPRQQEAQ